MRKRLIVLGALALALPAAVVVPWFGARRRAAYTSEIPEPPPYTFPAGFLWGTATAAHQVEGRQKSDWGAFEQGAGNIRNFAAYPEEVRRGKTGYDERFPQDLAMAAAMKHNAYRFSIEWSRLFPTQEQTEPDPAGVAYYGRVFDALEKNRLQPSVTLFHFTTPAWLWQERGGRRGWERDDALSHFERFVRAVARHFGGRASHFCTLNEPMVYVYNGYLEGIFPPGEKRGEPVRVAPVMAQLLRAHALAYRVLKEDAQRRGRQVQVGYTQHTRAFMPYRNWAPLDRVTAQMVAQAFIWDLPDAVQSGTLKLNGTSYQEDIAGLRGTQDYLGVNYYGRFYIKSDVLHPTRFQVLLHDPADPAEPRNDLGWALDPRGFAEVLGEAHRRYRLPIYVLENGTADGQDDDRQRQGLLVSHVREMWHAIHHHGADVRGYFHWSLIDNFEWAEGFEARFGLVKVDYLRGQARAPRPSAALFTRIIERNGLDAELLRR